MGRQQGAFSAAVESWIAPVAPPPKRLASANACSRSQLADGTESVEPEGSGVGAELGNGIDHRNPPSAGVRAAAHEAQQPASPASEQPPPAWLLHFNIPTADPALAYAIAKDTSQPEGSGPRS